MAVTGASVIGSARSVRVRGRRERRQCGRIHFGGAAGTDAPRVRNLLDDDVDAAFVEDEELDAGAAQVDSRRPDHAVRRRFHRLQRKRQPRVSFPSTSWSSPGKSGMTPVNCSCVYRGVHATLLSNERPNRRRRRRRRRVGQVDCRVARRGAVGAPLVDLDAVTNPLLDAPARRALGGAGSRALAPPRSASDGTRRCDRWPPTWSRPQAAWCWWRRSPPSLPGGAGVGTADRCGRARDPARRAARRRSRAARRRGARNAANPVTRIAPTSPLPPPRVPVVPVDAELSTAQR